MTLNKNTTADTVALASLLLGADCAIVAQSLRSLSRVSLPVRAIDLAIKRLLSAKLVRLDKNNNPELIHYSLTYVQETLGSHAATAVCTPI